MWRQIPTLRRGRESLSAEERPTQTEGSTPSLAPVPVPDLVGLPSTDARRLARAARIAVTVEECPSAEASWGRVLEQDPAPGTLDAPDGIVRITVGTRPRVTVPDIRGRDEAEALSILREVGLGADRRAIRRSDRVPEGCIVRTRPRHGTEVTAGSRVAYIVAAGPRESGEGRSRNSRREVRAVRLADGSFQLPKKDAPDSRR